MWDVPNNGCISKLALVLLHRGLKVVLLTGLKDLLLPGLKVVLVLLLKCFFSDSSR